MSRACTSEFVSIGQANLHEQEERKLGMRMQVGLREHEVRSNPRLEERADTSEPCMHEHEVRRQAHYIRSYEKR